MDAFFGTWKLVKKVNFDEFLKAIGVHETNDVPVTETVSKEGDHLVWTIKKGQHAAHMKFTLDKMFHDSTIEGKQCFSTISLKGKQLVQVKKWDKKEVTIIREVNGKNMTTTLKFGGVQGQRIYEKV
ncbi:fatty acid-binding protein, brain-like [Tachysurus fulvidraco]|uniref:fatty acid-binding protein, brain-like n=1 Tax=Tachysurus fulvidraco TaxID=1234273 RepID=UPI000F4EBD92|nr:fatty acid-binding protein, brain-like [Tachysurus fulvidraco]